MVVRIVIAGESQCQAFAEICLIADHLAQNLPNFCYERIEKPVSEWKIWLSKINKKNKWHHMDCPLIWKELLHKGSKPYYIGSASEFLDYCYSYYKFDKFVTSEKFKRLVKNYKQYQNNLKENNIVVTKKILSAQIAEQNPKTSYNVCISGAGCPLTMHLISGLLDMYMGNKSIGKIYIYDKDCSEAFMEYIESECNYIITRQSGKVVRYITKIGSVLTHTDLLIILDHVLFTPELSIGDWLNVNKKIMLEIALTINASASRKMYILIPNVGPACYNATILMNSVNNMNKRNIVVATSDLGLEIAPLAAEIAEVPMRNMFCPPVWGFVGINHLVDIRTTIHKYNQLEPYNRYIKVRNSSLSIGCVTPEMRTMEYLMHFDDTLWVKAAKIKANTTEMLPLSKAVAILDIVKIWLFDPNPNYIVNLGILCNDSSVPKLVGSGWDVETPISTEVPGTTECVRKGILYSLLHTYMQKTSIVYKGTFGLTFDGSFSQPSRLINGEWFPATDFMIPKDPQMKINYLENIAQKMMKLQKKELPKLVPCYPCSCKPKYFRKKELVNSATLSKTLSGRNRDFE